MPVKTRKRKRLWTRERITAKAIRGVAPKVPWGCPNLANSVFNGLPWEEFLKLWEGRH